MNAMNTKETTTIAMLAVVGALSGYIESLLIMPIVPGAKLGFANIVTIIAIYSLTFRHVVTIIIIRTLLTSILLGTFLAPGYFISLTGALSSAIAMFLIYRTFKDVSIVFLSIMGAVVHNLGQMLAAYFFISYGYIHLLPYLILIAVPAGYIIGMVSRKILDHLTANNIILAWGKKNL